MGMRTLVAIAFCLWAGTNAFAQSVHCTSTSNDTYSSASCESEGTTSEIWCDDVSCRLDTHETSHAPLTPEQRAKIKAEMQAEEDERKKEQLFEAVVGNLESDVNGKLCAGFPYASSNYPAPPKRFLSAETCEAFDQRRIGIIAVLPETWPTPQELSLLNRDLKTLCAGKDKGEIEKDDSIRIKGGCQGLIEAVSVTAYYVQYLQAKRQERCAHEFRPDMDPYCQAKP